MGSSRLRFILAFISGAVSMWFALSIITQHMLVIKRHSQSSLMNQPEVHKNIVPLYLHNKIQTSNLTTKDKDFKSNGISKDNLPGVPRGRGQLNKTRLLCWIMTSPQTLETRATMIARTWAKRCPQTLYMSSQKSTNFSGKVVRLEVAEGRSALWNKTRNSLEYIYKHHVNDADWFFKADDDTYVVVENLMAFLSNQDPSEPVYYGFGFNGTVPYLTTTSKKVEFPSGGAGYVMSREALKRFVEVGLQNRTGCCPDTYSDWPEDMCMGLCMETLGVHPEDHRDQFGRFRFLPIGLHYFLDDGSLPLEWLHSYSKYNITRGKDCCSESLISIHYVKPEEMLVYDFLINDVTVGLLDDNKK